MIVANQRMPDDVPAEHRPYQPRGAALAMMSCRADECLLEGPAGTGKTRAALEKVYAACRNYPGSRVLLLRKTRASMTDSVLEIWENRVVPPNHPCLSGAQRASRRSYVFPNGSEIVCGGLDKSSRVMSTQYDMIVVFEATEITEAEWEDVTTRARNGIMPYQQCIADCNPAHPTHWLNQRANAEKMTRLLSRHADNPSVTPAYLARLDALSGVRRLRLRDGVWAAAEGMVYDGWRDDVHLVNRFVIPPEWRRIRSVDFGYTNPFVCQWWAIDGDGRMYLYRELYATRGLVSDHARRIVELSAGESIETTVADHDAEDRATLDVAGIASLPAHKAIAPGIEAVQARLRDAGDGKPRLFLLRDALDARDERLAEAKRPLCTAQEVGGYVWAKSADGKPIKEQPVKIDDHGMDAMRYAVAYVDGLSMQNVDVRLVGAAADEWDDERHWR